MLESKREKLATAKRNANDKLTRNAEREAEFRRENDKRLQSDATKTARLRALRLAKEAEDREILAREAAEKLAARAARGPKPRKPATAA